MGPTNSTQLLAPVRLQTTCSGAGFKTRFLRFRTGPSLPGPRGQTKLHLFTGIFRVQTYRGHPKSIQKISVKRLLLSNRRALGFAVVRNVCCRRKRPAGFERWNEASAARHEHSECLGGASGGTASKASVCVGFKIPSRALFTYANRRALIRPHLPIRGFEMITVSPMSKNKV